MLCDQRAEDVSHIKLQKGADSAIKEYKKLLLGTNVFLEETLGLKIQRLEITYSIRALSYYLNFHDQEANTL